MAAHRMGAKKVNLAAVEARQAGRNQIFDGTPECAAKAAGDAARAVVCGRNGTAAMADAEAKRASKKERDNASSRKWNSKAACHCVSYYISCR